MFHTSIVECVVGSSFLTAVRQDRPARGKRVPSADVFAREGLGGRKRGRYITCCCSEGTLTSHGKKRLSWTSGSHSDRSQPISCNVAEGGVTENTAKGRVSAEAALPPSVGVSSLGGALNKAYPIKHKNNTIYTTPTKIRASVVGFSFAFPHPPEDKKIEK